MAVDAKDTAMMQLRPQVMACWEVCSRLRLKTKCTYYICERVQSVGDVHTLQVRSADNLLPAVPVYENSAEDPIYSRLPHDSRAFVLDQGKFLSPSTIPTVKQTII